MSLRYFDYSQLSARSARAAVLTFFGVLSALAVGLGPQQLRAEAARLALVVGNGDYAHLERLPNAARDARDIAAALQAQGFAVTLLLDGTRDAFARTITDFAAQATGAEAALFYFSGHGFQKGGVNYLAPIDARLDSVEAITAQTLRLDDVTDLMSASARHSILLLDACRNNPLPPGMDAELADGLAVPESGRDTFLAFATQPGNLTYDGREGQNSPFTRALLRHLGTEGQPISELMIRVRNEVESATSGQQIPWDQSSLTAPFFFNPFTPTPEDLADLAAMSDDRRARTMRMWRAQGAQIPEPGEADLQTAPPALDLSLPAPSGPDPGPEGFSFDLIILDEDLPEPADTLSGDGAITLAALPETRLPPGDIGVARALQQLSATDIRANARTAFVPDAPIEWLAALSPGLRGVDRPMNRARIIGEDVTPPEMNLPEMTEAELAAAVQTELQRVGCYRMAIDGAWGPGSRGALSDYFSRTGQTPLGTEPTGAILVMIRDSEGEICPAPVARATPARQAPARQAPAQATPPRQTAPQPAAPPAQAAPAPAAPSGGGSRLGGRTINRF